MLTAKSERNTTGKQVTRAVICLMAVCEHAYSRHSWCMVTPVFPSLVGSVITLAIPSCADAVVDVGFRCVAAWAVALRSGQAAVIAFGGAFI